MARKIWLAPLLISSSYALSKWVRCGSEGRSLFNQAAD